MSDFTKIQDSIALSDECKGYISEWVSIQNIVSNKKYDKEFLEPLSQNEIDDCKEKQIEQCETDQRCKIYTNSKDIQKCVKKDRIKKFKNKNTIIRGKNGVLYNCLDAKKLEIPNSELLALLTTDKTNQYNTHVKLMRYTYYYVLKSENTNNIYILFPTGGRLDIIDNIIVTDFLNKLIEDIIQKYENYNKIILAGHSFGCALALYTGMILKKKYQEVFDTKCIVLGSGTYKFIKNEDYLSFQNISNVKIFALALDLNPMVVDTFLDYPPIYIDHSNDASYERYSPITFLDFTIFCTNDKKYHSEKNTIIENIDLNDYMPNTEYADFLRNPGVVELNPYDEFIKKSFKDTDLSIFLHSWSNYFKCLSRLVNLDIDIQNKSKSIGSGGSRKRKTNKKKNITSRKRF